MIVLDAVSKRYRTDHGLGPWVLRDVSLSIPREVSVGLIGENGAGKSTLLNLIGGIDQPTRGEVLRKCRVSWPLGLAGGLHATLTGRQNTKFVCRLFGVGEDAGERIEFVKAFSELDAAFEEPIRTYSSGMSARLKFALSLAFDFDVYLVDELTAVGDARFKKKAREAFERLADHAGIIMVSHDEKSLMQFCKAGILLQGGKAHWYDDIRDALAEYKKGLMT